MTEIDQTITWLERAVIGLNLCPFAKAVYAKQQIHFAVSDATSASQLLDDLEREMLDLGQADPQVRDTTLLLAPRCLQGFAEFNDFLILADHTLRQQRLQGVLQIASFHPDYQFAGADPQDITNYSNRAPYPTLHLLRETSIERAVAAFPQVEQIFEKNADTLRALGHAGWDALQLSADTCRPKAEPNGLNRQ